MTDAAFTAVLGLLMFGGIVFLSDIRPVHVRAHAATPAIPNLSERMA